VSLGRSIDVLVSGAYVQVMGGLGSQVLREVESLERAIAIANVAADSVDGV
jgi:hypothetical protein